MPKSLASGFCDDWKLDEAGFAGAVVDLLLCLAIVLRFCPENIRDEGLRIAVIEWEPARLHLHHNAVPGQKDVISGWQVEPVQQRLARSNRLRGLEALAIPTTKDIRRYHPLITAHLRLPGDFVGVDVDELDHPVGVGSAGGGDEVGDGLPADLYRG